MPPFSKANQIDSRQAKRLRESAAAPETYIGPQLCKRYAVTVSLGIQYFSVFRPDENRDHIVALALAPMTCILLL